MSYDKEIYEKVDNELYNIRLSAREKLEKKKKIFYTRFPRAKEIESEIAKTSINIARAVVQGKEVRNALTELKAKNDRLNEELSEIMMSAGIPSNYFEISYKCPKCKDEGYVNGKMCVCMKDLLKKESYKKFNSVSPLGNCNFNSFSLEYYPDFEASGNKLTPKRRMHDILKYCREYVKNFNLKSKSMLFMGKTGLGKTHLSLSIASEVINNGYNVIYTSAWNMISTLENERFKNISAKSFSSSREDFINCDLLIIDDLGTEFSTGFSNSSLYDIIDTRLIFQRPIIISTNLSIEEFCKKYSPQIVSRVLGSYEILEFLGKDIRPKLRPERRK